MLRVIMARLGQSFSCADRQRTGIVAVGRAETDVRRLHKEKIARLEVQGNRNSLPVSLAHHPALPPAFGVFL